MTGNRALLTNFVEKFFGTVHFGNNDFAVIAGYGDVIIGSMTIKKVYYVEGFDILHKSLSRSFTCKSILPPWKQARKIYYWDLTSGIRSCGELLKRRNYRSDLKPFLINSNEKPNLISLSKMSDHEDETIPKENAHPKVVPQITIGNSAKSMTTDNDGNMKIHPPVTAEEHQQVQREEKAQTILLSALPDEHMEEGLDKGYDKMQKILTQMNTLKIKPDPEDVNMKFLRGPPSWSDQHLVYEDLDQMNKEDFEEYDLKHQMAMLSIKVHRFKKKHGRKIKFNGRENARLDKKLVKCFNCKQMGHFSRECRAQDGQNSNNYQKYKSKEAGKDRSDSKSMVVVDGLGLDKYIREGELGIDDSKFSIFYTNSDELEGQPIYNKFASVDQMKAVPLPLTGNYMPPSNIPNIDESQMMYGTKAIDSSEIKTNDDSISHSNDSVLFDFSDRSSEPSTSELQTCDSSVECSRPNKSDHNFNDSISSVSAPASESRDTIVINCVKQEDFPSVCTSRIKTDVKSSKTLCNKFGSFNKESHFRKHKSVASKSCYVCGSYLHLIKDCDLHEQRFAKSNVEGKGILRRRPTGKPVNLNRPKPVSTGQQKPVFADPLNPVFAGQQNPISAGPLNLVSAEHQNTVSAGQPNPVSAGDGILGPRPLNIQPKKKAKDRGIVDSGFSQSMSGNKDKLEDFEDFDGGEVTFGGSTGKISGKGTIKTKTLNFENVLYVEELQHFNLISVSQICDQTHRVLFTENECLVLSKDFPLPDPSMVILSISRKHNLYTFSLNELASKGHLTYLIAKASQTESTLWHRRLGHVNFKNMNKLNRTLIEAARTMLADSLLHTIFWTEAVTTACYVLNKVLVTKPHDKTSYELLTGDKPSIIYLKPFGCHVTILNISDPLGKFDKKSDEGYIVGYSISYNLVSRKIKETMNLIFLENKPFLAGTGQAWIFDINYLTDSLNYSRVSSTNLTAGSQGAKPSNAGSQEDDSDSDDEPDVLIIHFTPTPVVPIVDEATTQNDGTKSDHATTNADNLDELIELQALQRQEQAGKEEADQLGLAFPSLNPILGVGSAPIGSSVSADSTPPVSAGSTPPMSPCASPISADRYSISACKCHISAGRPSGSASRPVFAGKPTGSAGRPVSAGRPSGSTARTPVPVDIHDGLKIFDCPKSGIFTSSSYVKDFSGPDANNLESSLNVSSTITKRIHNIHPTSQVLSAINSPVQTRSQVKHKGSTESAFISYIHDQRRNNHTDFQLCMFSCFLSQEEPTTVAQALADPDWVEAIQAEM
nr:ribonuclease H-like domain-containing protein [Tanacetum cinerariifolium]